MENVEHLFCGHSAITSGQYKGTCTLNEGAYCKSKCKESACSSNGTWSKEP